DGIRDKLVTGVQTCALPIYNLAVVLSGCTDIDERVFLVAERLQHLIALRTQVLVGVLRLVRRLFRGRRIFRRLAVLFEPLLAARSEERRVGKECRCWWWLRQ